MATEAKAVIRQLKPGAPDGGPVSQKTEVGRVIYANSITLTPGTVSVDLDDESVMVHALSSEGVESLEEGEMDRRVRAIERNR